MNKLMDEFYLREIIKDDVPKINLWRNDKEIIDNLGTNYRFINIETDEEWFKKYQQNRVTQIRLAICLKKNDELLGVVYLTNIDMLNKNAEFSIMIGNKEFQNKGFGTRTTIQMLEHAFNNINIERVYLYVLESNKRAISVYNKCGFVTEGILRKMIFKNGIFQNQILMSILSEEFKQRDLIS